MNLMEPDVFWSDIVLGALAFGLGLWLGRRNRGAAGVFVALALATWTGAFYHGLVNTTARLSGDVLWSATLVLLGVTAGGLVHLAFERSRRVGTVLAVLLAVWAAFVIFVSEDFLWAMALQGVAVIVLVGRYLMTRRHVADFVSTGAWLAGFVGLDAVAVLQQQNDVTLGLPFSHNTLFHFIEMPAFVCLAVFFDRFERTHAD